MTAGLSCSSATPFAFGSGTYLDAQGNSLGTFGRQTLLGCGGRQASVLPGIAVQVQWTDSIPDFVCFGRDALPLRTTCTNSVDSLQSATLTVR